MHKILIVEDELPMLHGLKDNLEIEGFSIDTAASGNEGLAKILVNTYHLLILDVMLPGISGLDICKTIRKAGNTTPIIFLTARAGEIDKVLGLELGADDYITKPFSLRELLARIKAVLRRMPAEDSDLNNSSIVKIGRLQINYKTYEAFEGNTEIKMSHKEFEILHYLHSQKSMVVSRDELMEKVWGYDTDVTTRTVDNFIVKLRNKIEQTPNEPHTIITVHGIGYKLI
ncbi:MAG: response regulator transcription factor [Bacteroidetes bacterium]|nr:response regulator transcription factor [Bacteroidales bacterium]NJO68061.1 response regulator transcription factor [Bacteroidota bacterium]